MKVTSLIKIEDDLPNFGLIRAQDIKTKEDNEKFENYKIWNEEFYVYWIINYLEGNKKYYILQYWSILIPYNSRYFEISDSIVSKYWITNKYNIWFKWNDKYDWQQILKKSIEITWFPELVNDLGFIENLFDWKVEEEIIFKKYKKLMYLEFPDEKVKEKWKILLEPDWIQCPNCDYVWQEKCNYWMLECEECKTIMHNPIYKDFFEENKIIL